MVKLEEDSGDSWKAKRRKMVERGVDAKVEVS